jgi:hypothetical protein
MLAEINFSPVGQQVAARVYYLQPLRLIITGRVRWSEPCARHCCSPKASNRFSQLQASEVPQPFSISAAQISCPTKGKPCTSGTWVGLQCPFVIPATLLALDVSQRAATTA